LREAVKLANVPEEVRGFGDIKDTPMDSAIERLRGFLSADESVASGAARQA
jgi:hypothetical protein